MTTRDLRPTFGNKRLRYCNAREEWGFGKQATAALNRAALSAAAADAATTGRQLYLGRGAVAIDDQVAITSGVDVFGEGDATELIITGANKNALILSGRSRVRISGLKLSCDTGSTVAYKALLALVNCTDIIVEYVTSQAMPWAGIWAQDCKRLRIAHNQFSGVLDTSVPNCGDIVTYRIIDSTIEDNDCNGGGWQGIFVQKNDAVVETGNATNNRIHNNRVSNQSAYGICCYDFLRNHNRNIVTENKVHNIGGVNPNGAGGAGIYMLGEGGGVVHKNEIWDACKTTANETLTPAGIGVNMTPTDAPGINHGTQITENIVYGMAQYDCIRAVGSGPQHGLVIANNVLRQESGNGRGIRLYNCSSYSVSTNVITSPTTGTPGALIDVQSVTATSTGGSITGNALEGGTARGISIYSAGPSVEDISVTGNSIRSTAAGFLGIYVIGAGGVSISGGTRINCSLTTTRNQHSRVRIVR